MKVNDAHLDAIGLEIFRNAIESIVDECFVTLMKSAFSSNIKERRDHSVALFDSSARLIVQARQSLPIHLGSLSGLVDALLERKDDLVPGDILIANDPYEAGGTHLPDLNFAMPVFHAGQLVCFVCNIAHHSDFGGTVPGSMGGGMTEIYQEGLRVPLVHLYRAGELVSDVLSLILINTRVCAERRGDLLAQVAACRLGAHRIADLLNAYSLPTALTAFDDLMGRTEERIRNAIEGLPDGDYSFADVMDDDGLAERDIPICVTIRVRGRNMHVDFAGSANMVPGNINCTRSATRSAICYAIKALLDPDVPNNQGVVEAIDWSAPDASIVNAAYPAAVANRAHTVQRIIDAIIGAMAKAIPARVVAAANGANTTAVFTGVRPGTDERYIYLETLGGGFGARASKDGKDGVQVHITNTSNLPVEVIEMEYPLFVESYGFETDSGGAGRFRGGLGLRRVIRPIGHRCTFSGSGERFAHAPWGLFGGGDGKPGSFRLRRAGGELERLSNKPSTVEFSADEAVIIVTPGAGGYGQAEERAVCAIQEDLSSQKYSGAFIAANYPDASHRAAERADMISINDAAQGTASAATNAPSARKLQQIIGVYDALSAKVADRYKFDWLHVGGYNISGSRLGMPDVGLLTLTENLDATRRIVDSTSRPVLVDGDDGYGNYLNVIRLVREVEAAGARGIHLEDQVFPKKCGHMAGKRVVPAAEFVAKIAAFVDTRRSKEFLLFARTDAIAVEGFDAAVDRANRYLEAGADVIFIEAPTCFEQAITIPRKVNGPVLYNWVLGGKSPLIPLDRLAGAGFSYCLQADVLYAVAHALRGYFKDLRETHSYGDTVARMLSFDEFNDLIGLRRWIAAEARYGMLRKSSEKIHGPVPPL